MACVIWQLLLTHLPSILCNCFICFDASHVTIPSHTRLGTATTWLFEQYSKGDIETHELSSSALLVTALTALKINMMSKTRHAAYVPA